MITSMVDDCKEYVGGYSDTENVIVSKGNWLILIPYFPHINIYIAIAIAIGANNNNYKCACPNNLKRTLQNQKCNYGFEVHMHNS